MADIVLTCPECGDQSKVSEHVSAKSIPCPSCGHALRTPGYQSTTQLRLHRGPGGAAGNLAEPSVGFSGPSRPDVGDASTIMDEVYRQRGKARAPAQILGWLGFLLGLVVFTGLQWAVSRGMAHPQTYLWARLIAGSAIIGLVLVVAFMDSNFQGLLCLFIPGYIFFYGIFRLDSHALRGLFFALTLGLGTEYLFMNDRILLEIIQTRFNEIVQSGSKLIDRAGEAPVF